MCSIIGLGLLLMTSGALSQPVEEHFIDIGHEGDEDYIIEGVYAPEGPNAKSRAEFYRQNTFRWFSNSFKIKLPVFPETHNLVTLRFFGSRSILLTSDTGWSGAVHGLGTYRYEYSIGIPRQFIGSRREIVLTGRMQPPARPTARDPRQLGVTIDWIRVKPVDELPPDSQGDDYTMNNEPDLPIPDRLRGVEARPLTAHIPSYGRIMREEMVNVVTMGTMNGQGWAFFPSEQGIVHESMDPEWVPGVIEELHKSGIAAISWMVFNVQDVRDIEDFQPARKYPQYKMQFIEEPGKKHGPKVGMCVISSPYREIHAAFLREAASYGIDGVFFDGFYLNGIPHPGQAGCVCEHCRAKFARETGLEMPSVVDWADDTFKHWVRWRNHKLVETAVYFRDEMRKANPDLFVTCNYNIWPFGGKDWETAIPLWRTSDYGVSQHAYTGAPHMEWLMLGFKSRVSHDLNPEHCDIWRSSHYAFKPKGPYTDEDHARQELTMKTFMLAGTTYGVTPWHGGHIRPQGAGRRIHEAVRKREGTMSHDALRHVGVALSQNTHDFYGHAPGTQNLPDYQDAILGTWLLLTGEHVPFNFVFDNELEQGRFDDLKVILLPNTACLSDNAIDKLTAWVRQGGHLIATSETSLYDEWGHPRGDFGLHVGCSATDRPQNVHTTGIGTGQITYMPAEPGLAYARERSQAHRAALMAAINTTSLPIEFEAPATVVCNPFWGPERKTIMVQMLNVSAFMPGGDTGFRGVGRPAETAGEVASDAQLEAAGGHAARRNVPAHGVKVAPRAFEVRSARLLISGQDLTPDDAGAFIVPVVDDHEVLILDVSA